MTATLSDVTARKRPEPSAEEQAAGVACALGVSRGQAARWGRFRSRRSWSATATVSWDGFGADFHPASRTRRPAQKVLTVTPSPVAARTMSGAGSIHLKRGRGAPKGLDTKALVGTLLGGHRAGLDPRRVPSNMGTGWRQPTPWNRGQPAHARTVSTTGRSASSAVQTAQSSSPTSPGGSTTST